jgi:hypothetical protein
MPELLPELPPEEEEDPDGVPPDEPELELEFDIGPEPELEPELEAVPKMLLVSGGGAVFVPAETPQPIRATRAVTHVRKFG